MRQQKAFMEHEISLIQAFTLKERQERYLNLISTKKGRIKFRTYLSHFKDLNLKYCKVNIINQDANEVYNILKSKGAPELCYIISEHDQYDQKIVPLSRAIMLLFSSGISYFISCIPGQLAYYEGEEVNQKFILFK